MPSIPLADVMIAWTPNRPLWHGQPKVAPPGSIAIFHGPDDRGAFRRYPATRGNCDLDWREGDDNYRLQSLANLAAQWIERDGMNPDHVAEALRIIEGFERVTEFEPQRAAEEDDQ